MKYGDFYKGIGLSESDTGKFYRMVNVDVHTKPGKILNSKALEDIDDGDIAASTPTCSIVASDGNTYIGAGTKIIKINSSGTESLVHTNTQGAVIGLGEHQGYLYYASATKLGRQTVALAASEASWSSQNDSWGTFTNQKAYKPMEWVNQLLCIGDGNYVALVDETGTFVANGLDILQQDIITALMNTNDALSIGTLVNSAVNQASGYLWDTYSPSWTEQHVVGERGVNMMFTIDGYWYGQLGVDGSIYQWTGARWLLWKKLRDGDNDLTTGINPYGTTELNGLRLICTDRGVFSIGHADAALNIASVIEYVGSAGQGADLGCIEAVGNTFYLGWKDGTDYGIDTIASTYATGLLETPLDYGKARELSVKYNKIPTNCSVTARIAVDGGSFAAHTLLQDDEDLREYRSLYDIDNKSEVKAEITLVPNSEDQSTTPEIHLVEIQ